jgi:hypothetical protein
MLTKAMLDSSQKDKAVQDNIVESWLCVDCGTNTAPGFPSGPEMRLAIALGDKKLDVTFDVTFDSNTEVYHLKDKVWAKAGMRAWNGCLCIGCLEQRLGRQLQPKDFARHDDETWAQLPCSDRLLDRRGFRRIKVMTEDGEQELIVDKETADEMEQAAVHRVA